MCIRDSYYPFGGTFASADGNVQAYKYNGKELDTKKGLNWYDYGARQYDPALGRFTAVDPLTEKYYEMSPYTYCGNNPIKYIDPTGADMVIWYGDENGKQRYFMLDVYKRQTYTSADRSGCREQVIYYDGLGRPSQTVDRSITPDKKDIVSLQEYDDQGRKLRTWLPAKSTGNGSYMNISDVYKRQSSLWSKTGRCG